MGLDMGINRTTIEGEEEIITLRKANQIRGYFANLKDFADGDVTNVSYDDMYALKTILGALLKEKDENLEAAVLMAAKVLPPTQGFFFGGKEIDEWYWEDIQNTYNALNRANIQPSDKFSYWEWY